METRAENRTGRRASDALEARMADPRADERWVARSLSIAQLAGGTALLIGAVHLVLWQLGVVAQWAAVGAVTMKTNTALAQALAAVALLILNGRRATRFGRAIAVGAAALVLLAGVLTLGEHVLGVDLGIDQLLSSEPPGAGGVTSPNRMGPPAAACFVLLGAGLLALAWRRRAHVVLGLATCTLMLVPAVGFLYRLGALHSVKNVTSIAWPTVIGVFLLGLGLAFAVRPGGATPLFWRDDPGGTLMRRTVVPAVLAPLLIGLLRLEGERRGLYERHLGTGAFAISLVLVVLALLWRSAERLSESASRQASAERQATWRASLLDLAHDAILVWAPESGIESWNRGAEELYGYDQREALGRSTHELLATVFPRPWTEILAELERAGRWKGEFVHRTKTGERVTVSVNLQLVQGDDGRPRILETCRDVTESRRAADRLAAEKARLAVTLASIGDAVIATDRHRRVTVFNRVAERLTGWTEKEALGRRLEEPFRIVNEATRRPAEDPVDRVLRDGAVVGLANHTALVARDGSECPVADSAAPIRDPGGNVQGVVLVFRDQSEERRVASELRQAVESLREADRHKDEFLAMLSHELRNPLAPIRNALYILDRVDPSGEQARRAREVANRQVAHITRLVDDLLDVTRIARGKIELRRTDVDLAALARRAAEDHRPSMEARHLALLVDVPETAPVVVSGDETRLAQVLGNLLHNAAKFTPRGGRVTLALETLERKAVLHVRDTGPGIDPEVLPFVFEPFTQANQSLARTEGGLGLGLALVKGIVALHGGDVSAGPGLGGRGTDLVVTVPLVPAPGAVAAAVGGDGASARAAAVRRRVLVVDDNTDAADTLAELVEMLGHEAEVAHDGPSALDKVRAGRPDVVLCDIGLPGMSGYDVARALRADAANGLRLVAVSGYAQPEDVAEALEAGFDGHVAKPPDPDELARLIG